MNREKIMIRYFYQWVIVLGIIGFVFSSCNKNTRLLNYRGQEVSSFPDSICSLIKLQKLHFGSSGYTIYPPLAVLPQGNSIRIDTLPNCLENLIELRELTLSGVGLKKINPVIFGLKSLKRLDVSLNPELNLNTYWEGLHSLPKLKFLNLSGCKVDSMELSDYKLAHPAVEVITMNELGEMINK